MSEAIQPSQERAGYYIHQCKTLRELAGLSINSLARKAEVDRSTVSKIEKKHPVTGAIAGRVFNALNEASKNTLKFEIEVTTSATPVMQKNAKKSA